MQWMDQQRRFRSLDQCTTGQIRFSVVQASLLRTLMSLRLTKVFFRLLLNCSNTSTRTKLRENPPFLTKKSANVLATARPKDLRSPTTVCDRSGFVDDLVHSFLRHGRVKYIEGNVRKLNFTKSFVVVGALLVANAVLEELVMRISNNAFFRDTDF